MVPRRKPGQPTFLTRLLVCVVLLYGLGFVAFLGSLPEPFVGMPKVQYLAVFTGGTNRVPTALDIVEKGYTGPLMISGVHPDVKLQELMVGRNIPPEAMANVTLDMSALTTKQNVRNTALWAVAQGASVGDVLGIVTSTYHVPRVKLLLKTYAPALAVQMIPVQPQELGISALLREYHKVLVFWLIA